MRKVQITPCVVREHRTDNNSLRASWVSPTEWCHSGVVSRFVQFFYLKLASGCVATTGFNPSHLQTWLEMWKWGSLWSYRVLGDKLMLPNDPDFSEVFGGTALMYREAEVLSFQYENRKKKRKTMWNMYTVWKSSYTERLSSTVEGCLNICIEEAHSKCVSC